MSNYGPYAFGIRYDPKQRKLHFFINDQEHVWDIAELDRQAENE